MVVLIPQSRDAAAIRAGLLAWFTARWEHATDVAVLDLRASAGNGLSSETFELELGWSEEGVGQQRKLVVRRPPAPGQGVFADYDLVKQARVQSALAVAGIPVADPIGVEPDPRWIDSPFLVMPFIEGRIAGSDYLAAGWVADLTGPGRHTVLTHYTDAMADVHRLDWRTLGLGSVVRDGGPGLPAELSWWSDYLDWAGTGLPAADSDPVVELLAWCSNRQPTSNAPDSLVWGDPRLANVVFDDDLGVSALLDWETVTIAPAEVDLGWHFAMRKTMAQRYGPPTVPELAGFPSMAQELARYERRLGRPVQDLEWHIIFGGVRTAICTLAIRRAAIRADLPAYLKIPIIPAWVADDQRAWR